MPSKQVPVASSSSTLPAPLTPLLGRAAELEETSKMLEGTRLLTITGAGGSGKTRLALELAHRAATRFDDGAIWVDLAPLTDPDLVPQEILAALDIREVATSDVVQIVIERLNDRSLLLVFDNCEHLVDACASVAESILRGCPGITILATTREALGIVGEQTWLVPPMVDSDAAQLFAERAHAVAPSFDAAANAQWISQICRRLDGIPLAIELAAARVKVLSVEQISERLADAFNLLSSGSRTLPRHRTIRETIDWSFRLLSPAEQILFRRLAVFHGNFSLAGVEAICSGDGLDRERIFESLSALLDKSLVVCTRTGATGYRLLETVRQFASAKLDEVRERERLRERHAHFFVDHVIQNEPRLFAGAVDAPTMLIIDREIDNIRAVFDWCEEDRSRAELELRLIYALHWYWFARGHFHEARRRTDEGLARGTNADPHVRARALVAAGNAAAWQARWGSIRPGIDEAITVLRQTNDLRPLANALMLSGTASAFGGNPVAAKPALDEAVEIARQNGRNVALALMLYWAALAAQMRGDSAYARRALEECYQIGVDTGSKPAIGHSMTALGHIEQNAEEAIRCFRIAFDVHSETDDRWGLTQVVEGIAYILLAQGKKESGIRLLAAASAAWLQLGAASWDSGERMRHALSDPKLRVAIASGASMSYEAMIGLAREELDRLGGTPAPAAATLRVRALGPLEIARGEQMLDAATSGARSRELLLFLLCQSGGSTKDQIGAALWPDANPTKLRNNFHVTLHRLRKTLGNVVRVEGDSYVVDRAAVEFDAEVFEREATAAMRALEKDPAAADRLSAVLDLYRGDFFSNAPTGEWYEAVRDRLRDLYAGALSSLGRLRMAAGDFARAADVYERLITLDEFDEQAVRNLMRCLAKTGNTTAVSRAYRRLTTSLRRELGTDPDPATTNLHERITSGAE